MTRVRRTRRSKQDALEVWLYVAAHDVDAADRLLDRIEESLAALADAPEMGRARPELHPTVRSLPVGSYLLMYRLRGDAIELVRILHGARNLRRAFNR